MRWTLVIALVALVFMACGSNNTANNTAGGNADPSIKISAADLYSAYKDPSAADRVYKGKRLNVTGILVGKSAGSDGVTFYLLVGEGSGVQCVSKNEQWTKAAWGVPARQQVSIWGTCLGKITGADSVGLTDCSFTE